ncbi:MAG: hypothetical protein H7259_00565, partial [Cytophagales bacterium]|nr:hypothetical protein [Cytophaga sp.]
SYKTALYPAEFKQLFAASFLTSLTEPLVWIRLTMPSVLDAHTLAPLTVQINAFPVINRKHIEHTHRFKDITNVIPVQTGTFEYFLSVDELTDSRAKVYRQIPYSENGSESAGSYSLRKGGTGRVDARSAKEYLIHLKDLIRDESAAFASYGQDTVNNLLKEMDKLLAQLDQRIKKHNQFHTDAYYYVTVEHAAYNETFFLYYWVTNSIHANGIYAGTKLNIYKGSQLKSGSVHLLTATTGGKNVLEPSRHIDAWKYASLTHNKIVTAEDIKAFCIHELGSKIESVSIRKGLIASTHPKQGLVRCVEVLLKKNASDAAASDQTEWDVELKSLQSKMELRSSLNLNMKVLLVE